MKWAVMPLNYLFVSFVMQFWLLNFSFSKHIVKFFLYVSIMEVSVSVHMGLRIDGQANKRLNIRLRVVHTFKYVYFYL